MVILENARLQEDILHTTVDHAFMGQGGIVQVACYFWLPGLVSQVKRSIKHCHAHQVMKKAGNRTRAGKLRPPQPDLLECPWAS